MTTKKKVAKKTVEKQKNKIIFVLDNSGSMHSFGNSRIESKVNTIFEELKKNAVNFNQETDVTFYLFNSQLREVYKDRNILDIPKYTSYYCSGQTALFDAVNKSILEAQKSKDYNDENTSFLVLILTDGGENSSEISATSLNKLLTTVDKTGRWTVTFQVPFGEKQSLVRLGIYADNIREWEQNLAGLNQAEQTMSAGLTNYYNSRSNGATSVRSFYVQPDLSQVKKKKLNECADLSGQFELYEVPKEYKIKEFVVKKTGNFIKGNNYYQLSKKEKVQSYKQVLLLDKKTNKIYGGDEARALIGAPEGQEFKVEPGNHANFDIFIESTSVNRILVRGSKVLVKK